MKKASQAAARRYARALLDVALEKGAAADVRKQLEEAAALLGGNRELLAVLSHPAVSAARKQKIVAAIRGKQQEGGLVARLLELLVERERIQLLPALAEIFVSLYNEQRRVVAAEAVSAVPLEDPQRAALGDAIGRATGLSVELTTRVEPEVLGGLRVAMGGRVYDGTVRARLRTLRERLVGVARP